MLRQRLGDGGRQALERLVGDDVVGLHRVLQDLGERGPERRGEHGGRADQCDADHQRRGSGRGAARRAAGVLLSELPGWPEELGDRPADQPRHGTGDRRREAGDAEEDEQRADPGEGQRPDGAARAHEQADDEHHRTDHGDDRADARGGGCSSPRTRARGASPRPVGSSRRRRAGTIDRQQRHADADDGGDDHGPRRAARSRCRGTPRRRR